MSQKMDLAKEAASREKTLALYNSAIPKLLKSVKGNPQTFTEDEVSSIVVAMLTVVAFCDLGVEKNNTDPGYDKAADEIEDRIRDVTVRFAVKGIIE